jgi:phenylalanyl-tRNA synthetase beta chain
MRLAGLAYGCVGKASWEGKSPVFDFYDVKAHVQSLLPDHVLGFEAAHHPALHPGRSARVRLNGQDLGFVGELHPLWKQEWGFAHAPVLFELDLQGVLSRQIPQFKAFSKYPVVERDLAVWVKESVSHQQLMNCIRSAPVQGLLKNAILFDLYRPDHASQQPEGLEPEKSMAVRLVLSRDDASLTEADIDMAFSGVIAHVTAQLGARLRA